MAYDLEIAGSGGRSDGPSGNASHNDPESIPDPQLPRAMSADPQKPIPLQVGSNLSHLLKACEATCVADCCGLDAFDFSPLYAAADLSRYTGEISARAMDEISEQLRDLLNQAAGLAPTPEGWICVIDQVNQYFTHEDLVRFTERVERCVRLAPQVLKYARELDASSS